MVQAKIMAKLVSQRDNYVRGIDVRSLMVGSSIAVTLPESALFVEVCIQTVDRDTMRISEVCLWYVLCRSSLEPTKDGVSLYGVRHVANSKDGISIISSLEVVHHYVDILVGIPQIAYVGIAVVGHEVWGIYGIGSRPLDVLNPWSGQLVAFLIVFRGHKRHADRLAVAEKPATVHHVDIAYKLLQPACRNVLV